MIPKRKEKKALMFLYGGNFGGYEISIAVKLLFLGAINIIFFIR